MFTFRQCLNKQCIDRENVCDNERSCFDKSDEFCNSPLSLLEKYQKS